MCSSAWWRPSNRTSGSSSSRATLSLILAAHSLRPLYDSADREAVDDGRVRRLDGRDLARPARRRCGTPASRRGTPRRRAPGPATVASRAAASPRAVTRGRGRRTGRRMAASVPAPATPATWRGGPGRHPSDRPPASPGRRTRLAANDPDEVRAPATTAGAPRVEPRPNGRADQDHLRHPPQRQRGAPRPVRGGPREGEGPPGRLPPELRRRRRARRRRHVRGPLAHRQRHRRRDVRQGHPEGRPGRDRRRPPRPAGVVPAGLGEAPGDPARAPRS